MTRESDGNELSFLRYMECVPRLQQVNDALRCVSVLGDCGLC